jgi:fatty acyl-CoA reductase
MVEVFMDRIDDQEMAVIDSKCKSESPMKSSPMECPLTEDLLPVNEKFSPIQEFYHGQSIFITGGTGFIGKLLIEKLLRTCSGLASIYLLVRPKKGKDVHQRAEEIFDDVVSF